MKMPWWLIALGAILAAVLGIKTVYEKRLEDERENAIKAHGRAIDAGDAAGASLAAAVAARSELKLQRERSTPIADRAAKRVREARVRRAAGY